MTKEELDAHLAYCAEKFWNLLPTGRITKASQTAVAAIMADIYEPMVKRIREDCDLYSERIDLYQREIELLTEQLKEAINIAGYRCVGTYENKRIYIKEFK